MSINDIIKAVRPWPHYTPHIVVEMMSLSLMGDYVPMENPPFKEGGKQ